MKPSKSVRGFSLVELMAVISVSAVLAGLALPEVAGMLSNSRVKSAATDAYAALSYARSEAIARNATVTVAAAPGGWANGLQVSSGGTLLRQFGPYPKIDVNGPAPTAVSFNPYGRISSAPSVTFTFSQPGSATVRTRCVFATFSGRPVIQADLNGDGNCANG